MTVVFLHAFPLDPRMWDGQRALAPGSEAPLLYGLGETMDDWARAILDRHPGELVLVGASMGGYVAYHAARLEPDRIRGLLTVGARAQADAPAGRTRRDELARSAREQGPRAVWEAMRETLFSQNAAAGAVEQARAWTLEQDAEELARALEVMRDRRDTTDLLGLLDPQPLAVLGELDPVARPGDFSGVLVEERVVVVRETGHLPMLERPDRFDPILEEFLESHAESD